MSKVVILMKNLFFIILISFVQNSYASIDNLKPKFWTKTFGGKNDEFSFSVKQTKDKKFIIAGNRSIYGVTGIKSSNILLIKMDINKKIIWQKVLKSRSLKYVTSLIVTPNGNFIIVGKKSHKKKNVDNNDIFVIKTNSAGRKIWEKSFGGEGNDYPKSITNSKDGGFVIAGVTNSYGSGEYDIWILKINSRGKKVWSKFIGGVFDDFSQTIITTKGGNYVFAGSMQKSARGEPELLLIKLNKKGKIIWKKSTDEIAGGLVLTKDDGFISIGSKNIFRNQIFNTYMTKFNRHGEKMWQRVLRGDFSKITQLANETLILIGKTKGFNADLKILKLDKDGEEIWSQTMGGEKDDVASDIVVTKRGDYLLVGNTDSYGKGRYDIWAIRFNEDWIATDLKKDEIFNYLDKKLEELENFLHSYKYNLKTVAFEGDNHILYDLVVNKKECSLDKIKLLVDKGMRVDRSFKGNLDMDWFAPAHLFLSSPHCKKNGLEIVDYLHKQKLLKLDKKAKYGRTPLYEAVSSLNMKGVKYLINQKMDVKTEDMFGNGLLHLLAKSGHHPKVRIEILKLLLSHKLNINKQNRYYNTPLVVAIDNKSEEVALFLINNRADIGIHYKKRVPLLTLAVIQNQNDVAKLLIENGANLNDDTKRGKYNPLANAILYKNQNMFRYLIAKGADVNVNISSRNYKFPLIIGLLNQKKLSQNRLFLDRPIIKADSTRGFSTANLPQLLGYIKRKKIEELKALIEHGADVNAIGTVNGQKMTPLHIAVGRNDVASVEILLKNGAKKELLYKIKDENGMSVVDFAKKKKFKRILKLLGE